MWGILTWAILSILWLGKTFYSYLFLHSVQFLAKPQDFNFKKIRKPPEKIAKIRKNVLDGNLVRFYPKKKLW